MICARELRAARAARARCRRQPHRRRLGQGGLDPLLRRPVHRRLVDLRVRDRRLLHARVQGSEAGHVQGDLLLRPRVPCRVHPCAAVLPGRSRTDGNAGAGHLQRHGGWQGHGGDARRRSVHRDGRRHSADLRADADHHDGDGWIVPHASIRHRSMAGCRAIYRMSTSTARPRGRCGRTSASI